MLTLEKKSNSLSKLNGLPEISLERALSRLASSMTRAAAETAGAFFCTKTSEGASWEVPRLSYQESIFCSQINMGEKYEMLCNLAVDKSDWTKMFTSGESDLFQMDTFCELANCICGTVLADPSFADEFGNLIPCVPFSGVSAQGHPGSKTFRGAFRLSGFLVHFSFTVQECSICAVNHPQSVAA